MDKVARNLIFALAGEIRGVGLLIIVAGGGDDVQFRSSRNGAQVFDVRDRSGASDANSTTDTRLLGCAEFLNY